MNISHTGTFRSQNLEQLHREGQNEGCGFSMLISWEGHSSFSFFWCLVAGEDWCGSRRICGKKWEGHLKMVKVKGDRALWMVESSLEPSKKGSPKIKFHDIYNS